VVRVPITFSHADQWTSFSELGRFPLVLKPIVASSKLNKVLIDGGSGLNVLFNKTLKKMKLDNTDMLTKGASPFYGIVLGNAANPLGSVVLLVTFMETREDSTESWRPSTSSPCGSKSSRSPKQRLTEYSTS
jgi:hypothetical protein